MPWYDMPLERLREYRTSTQEPDGLDDWWAARLREARDRARPVAVTAHEPGLYAPFEVSDVEFSGGAGERVRAWYITPAGRGAGGVVVKFIGYGGGRGAPAEHILLPALGYAVLVMDSRGQGGRWSSGRDRRRHRHRPGELPGHDPRHHHPGGVLLHPDVHRRRARGRHRARARRAVAARWRSAAGSQGGALALAAAALRPDVVAVCHADVPFLCDIQRAITLAPHAPYTEIPEFLAENVELVPQALDTLRYIDCALLARRITAATLVSVGLMDDICPPSTVYAAYNEINAADKDIAVYPYSGHSWPRAHVERQLRHLRERLPV